MSMVHPHPQKKATPYVSKVVNTSGKSSKLIIPNKDKITAKGESRLKRFELRNPSMHANDPVNPMIAERSAIDKELRKFIASILGEVNSDVFPDVQTSLEKDPSPDNESKENAEENVPDHTGRERRSKKKASLLSMLKNLPLMKNPLQTLFPVLPRDYRDIKENLLLLKILPPGKRREKLMG